MSSSLTYALVFAFTILLFMSYTAIDQQSYYSAPIDASPDLGVGFLPGMLIFAAVEIGNRTLRAYELAMASHAPLSSPDGSEPPLNGIVRALDTEDGNTACNSVVVSNLTGTIVLVQRGNCNLFKIVANCQQKGARAVLISEDSPLGASTTEELDTTAEVLTPLRIPAMIVPQKDFKWLLQHTEEEASVWTLSPELDPSVLRILMLLFVRPLIMMTLVLIVVFVNLHGKKVKKRLSPSLVWSLPRRQWDPSREGVWHQNQCSICLEEFTPNCEVMTLPCSHDFHVQCVSQWLLRRRGVCPLCFQEVCSERTPLLTP